MTLPGLVPQPVAVRHDPRAEPFPLSAETVISGDAAAADDLAALVRSRTGLALRTAEGGSIRLSISHGGAAESYRVRVDSTSAVVVGADAAGLFYGVQTLSQLLAVDRERWTLPAVEIDDFPRFAYRGVMLDVARHFFDVATVKAYIDRAASLKCNHLHLHLTDDQGWRLELRSRPELTARAAGTAVGGDAGGYYTTADYAEIVAYAARRHLTVVPEIDVPGHTHAVGLAYPDIVAPPAVTDEVRAVAAEFGGGIPIAGEPYTGMAVGFSSLRIGDAETERFLADVFGELAEVTPGPYLHLGGDEALGTAPDDYAAFVARAVEIAAATGKTPMAWHEAGAAGVRVVGQYWGFLHPDDAQLRAARTIVGAGGALVLSPADAAYLDMKPSPAASLGLVWANGPTSVERAYSWEPTEVLPGVAEADILGVEAPLWTETVRTLADVDSLAFPRLAAVAEIAWSADPATDPERTWPSFRRRVGALGPLWQAQGIGFDRSHEIAWADE